MHIFGIIVVLQILAIIHVVRTGRDMRWIFLLLFVPGIGVLVYLLIEVLPSLGQNITARRAMRNVRNRIDPERGVRAATLEFERSGSVEAASRLADELTRAGRHDEAIRICEEARQGLFEDDPKILVSLANAQFGGGRFRDTVATLDRLRSVHPGHRSPEGHLIYARALEEAGETDRALEEYAALAGYFPGAEARVRQALCYKKIGQTAKASELFAAILRDARLAPKHFQRAQREWLEMAKREQNPAPAERQLEPRKGR
jgi:hypothetical protein